MKTILYFHPISGPNIGDDITFAGAYLLVQKAIGKHTVKTFYSENIEDVNPDLTKDVDALVLGGTPWLWDQDQSSGKYKVLGAIVEQLESKPKIALGIGSGYPLGIVPIEGSGAGEVWRKFHFIHTRDSLAAGILSSAGIANTYSFCTSAHAPIYNDKFFPADNRPVVVYYTPYNGVAKSVLQEEFFKTYDYFMHRVIRRYNARVIAVTEHEKEELVPHGIDVFVPKTIEDIPRFLYGASFVLSGRVHVAIPAARIGIPTYIMPVDSRWLTTLPFGILPVHDKQIKEGDPYLLPFKPIDNSKLIEVERTRLVESISRYL